MTILDLDLPGLVGVYLLLIIPIGLILWLKIPLLGQTLIAIARMTLQLLLVGFYLQVIFDLNRLWLSGLWILVMVAVADLSILRSCQLRLRQMFGILFVALIFGTLVPLLVLLTSIASPEATGAQYVIPIAGMILGNCLRADIIGLEQFFSALRREENSYRLSLAQGASLAEAQRPFIARAVQAALAPTVATMATIGLVALPGMMTGVILAGGNPMTAIKYQIAIMTGIFAGTALTVWLAISLAARRNFNRYGLLRNEIFREG